MPTEKNYDFCKRLLEVHKKDRRNPDLLPKENEFSFQSPTAILIPKDSDEMMLTAARDFAEYLFTSMGVAAYVDCDRADAPKGSVRLALDESMKDVARYRGYRVAVEEGVLVRGYDARGVAQGLYYLEDLMNLREAPFLEKGSTARQMIFSSRCVSSGYGVGEFPDEYLAMLAHHGFTALDLWVRGINETKKGFCNFKDIAFRAQKYGFDIYIMSFSAHEVYPEGEEAQKFYDRLYGDLFAEMPFIKGLTIVGEAVKFPSRDPSVPEGVDPGWWPCSDWPLLLSMIQKAVYKYRPDAEIILSSYNWGLKPKEVRQKLIASLPKGVVLNCGWEMFEHYDLDGMDELCCDYSLRVVKPGYYFLTEAEEAVRQGIELRTIANTGGKTWDFGAIPYVPAPYRWAERFEALRDAHDHCGLEGLLDSIHYGVFPSFITEIAKWAFSEPRVDLNEMIPRILAMHFGKTDIDKIDTAMRKWSEALANIVPINDDQYGPLRIGPSHPLYSDRPFDVGLNPPQDKFAMHRNSIGMYHSIYQYDDPTWTPRPVRIPKELVAYERMKRCLEEGIALLEGISKKNEELLRLINMGRFMYRTVITTIHTKRYYLLDQERLLAESDEAREKAILAMLELLQEERQNAEDSIPLVEYDSSIGFEPSMHYVTDPKRILWKLSQVDEEMRMLRSLIEK